MNGTDSAKRWLKRMAAAMRGVAVALALCVIVLWVRSYQGGDAFCHFGPGGFELVSGRGRLALWLYRGFENVRTPWMWKRSGSSQRHTLDAEQMYNGEHGGPVFLIPKLAAWEKGGTYYRDPIRDTQTHVDWHVLVAPHWLLTITLLAWPVYFALVPWRRRWIVERRRAAGLCLHCGYDLRGGGERCPECGEAVPSSGSS